VGTARAVAPVENEDTAHWVSCDMARSPAKPAPDVCVIDADWFACPGEVDASRWQAVILMRVKGMGEIYYGS